jgi:hypothetical protein
VDPIVARRGFIARRGEQRFDKPGITPALAPAARAIGSALDCETYWRRGAGREMGDQALCAGRFRPPSVLVVEVVAHILTYHIVSVARHALGNISTAG